MTFDSPPVPALARGGRVRLRTLITVRWIAIAGQVAALGIVRYGLGFPLPIAPAVAVVGASAALNLWLGQPAPRLGPAQRPHGGPPARL